MLKNYQGPPIVIGDSLQTMTAIARDNVELKCPITSDPPPFYDWFKVRHEYSVLAADIYFLDN